MKDTINDATSLDVSVLGKVELYELPEAAGVIVVHCFSIPKGFHDGTTERIKTIKQICYYKEAFKMYPVSTHCSDSDVDPDYLIMSKAELG